MTIESHTQFTSSFITVPLEDASLIANLQNSVLNKTESWVCFFVFVYVYVLVSIYVFKWDTLSGEISSNSNRVSGVLQYSYSNFTLTIETIKVSLLFYSCENMQNDYVLGIYICIVKLYLINKHLHFEYNTPKSQPTYVQPIYATLKSK